MDSIPGRNSEESKNFYVFIQKNCPINNLLCEREPALDARCHLLTCMKEGSVNL